MSKPFIEYGEYDDDDSVTHVLIRNNLSNFLPVDSSNFVTLPVPIRIYTKNCTKTTDSTYTATGSDMFNYCDPFVLDGTQLTPFGYVKGLVYAWSTNTKSYGEGTMRACYYITGIKHQTVDILESDLSSYFFVYRFWPSRWNPVSVEDPLHNNLFYITDQRLTNSGVYNSRPSVLSFSRIATSNLNPVTDSNARLVAGAFPSSLG